MRSSAAKHLDPHEACDLYDNCGANCPRAIERRARDARRAKGQAERWAKLTPPDRDSYHYLEGQPISCGAALELQRTEVRSDDYGDYTFYLPDGVRVRFEIAHGPGGTRTPVLYANVGGFSFTSEVEPGMRFRWPRGGR